MILYFSGTGNSRYVAHKIAQELNDELISINQLIKKGKTDELMSIDKPFVFVCPTYAWRLPIVVTYFIKNTKFLGSNKVYFVMTCGRDTAKAINYIQRLCKYKEWQLKGMAEIKVPENYIALFSVPDKEISKQIIIDTYKKYASINIFKKRIFYSIKYVLHNQRNYNIHRLYLFQHILHSTFYFHYIYNYEPHILYQMVL